MASNVAARRPCVSASSPKKGVDAQEAANEAAASRAASSGGMPKACPAHGGKKARRLVCNDCATTNSPIAGIVNRWKRPNPIRSSVASTSIGRRADAMVGAEPIFGEFCVGVASVDLAKRPTTRR
jgi:hypothetical protein